MDDYFELYSRRPLKLCSTRVWRTYTGGKLIEEWQGKESAVDTQFPEEWVASLIIARNPGREHILEGLSEVETEDNSKLTLKDLIDGNPVGFLGEAHVSKFDNNTGVLVKMLDSAERLTIQVHPDQDIALKLFNSCYGKTEAWYIVGSREIDGEPPYVLFGFKPGIAREKWKKIFDEQNTDEMLEALHKFYVKPGDMFLIEGGIPHAIGPGCLLIEIQEPTDFTIRTERVTPKGLAVPDQSCHQGVGFERMFDCFHYEGLSREEVLNRWSLKPVVIKESAGGKESSLITYDQTTKFAMNLVYVNTEMKLEWKDSFSSLLVVSGLGALCWNDGEMDIRQGEQVFLPYNAGEVVCVNKGKEFLKLMRCFPPV